MKFSGTGPTASKLARWLNSLVAGSLVKFVRGSRGIEVLSAGAHGVVISTSAAIAQVFQLATGKHEIVSGIVVGYLTAPGESPDGDAEDQDIYFTYAPGWYAEAQHVVCQNILGQWEVMSPSAGDHLEGTISEDLDPGGDHDVEIVGTYAGTVSAHNTYNLDGQNGDVVGVEWNPNRQQFVITAIKCPYFADADGGSWDAAGDTENGGDWSTSGGNLDGGAW